MKSPSKHLVETIESATHPLCLDSLVTIALQLVYDGDAAGAAILARQGVHGGSQGRRESFYQLLGMRGVLDGIELHRDHMRTKRSLRRMSSSARKSLRLA